MASHQINYSKFTMHFSLFVFIIFYSFYLILRFKNIEPMGDQAFQIYWLSNLLNREVFASDNTNIGFFKSLFDQIFIKKNLSIGELKIFLTENYPDNFFYHLAKVMASPNNFFAYYWHSFYIIVLYIFNLCFGNWFENLNESYVYFSIIFSSLSIYICYLIYEMFLQKIDFSKNSISIKVIIFILSTLSYHKFYYSPLGVHNFAIFMFLITVYFFLKIIINNSGNYKKYFYLGLLCSISIISHQANFLLLFPTIFICIFFLSNKLYSIKIKNLFSFMIFPFLVLTPLLFLCYLTFIKAGPGGETFTLHYFLRFGDENYKLESFFLWLKNISILIGPILIVSIFFFKNKESGIFKNFYFLVFVLFSIHIFFTIITGWFIESYIRNMLYLNNIITILFSIIIFNNIFKKNYFKATLVIIGLSFIFNFSLILSNKNLKNLNDHFYTSYSFNSENKINEFQKLFLKKINLENKNENYHIFFSSQMSMSYLSVYNKDIYYRNIKNFRKPIDQIGVIDTDLITFDNEFKNYYLYSILPINIGLDEKYHFEQFKKKYKQFNTCSLTIEPNLNSKIQLLDTVYMHKFYKLDCSSI